MTSQAPPSPDGLFAYMVQLLLRAVAASSASRTPWGTARLPLPEARIGLFHGWLKRTGRRFAALVALARQGRVPPPRVRAPRPAPARDGTARPPGLPRGFGWLVRLVPETAVGDMQMRLVLADPEMARLIAIAPGLGRVMRPLCRALGVEPPPGMLPPSAPRRPPASRATASRRAPPPAAPPVRRATRRAGAVGRVSAARRVRPA